MDTFPDKFGFLKGLDECVGKTIEQAEVIGMEFGCTWNSAWAVKFTDGSRVFFVGAKGSGIMNPSLESIAGLRGVEQSEVFTADEYGEMVAAKKKKREKAHADALAREKEQYEKLKAKFEH